MSVLFSLVAAADVAKEGKDIILSMLVVGLIFIGVIALGQLFEWLAHRRHQS
jgi:heme/copper-type cytochrome/quinol oxidase subunit 2